MLVTIRSAVQEVTLAAMAIAGSVCVLMDAPLWGPGTVMITGL
jgi:hypothetical protein